MSFLSDIGIYLKYQHLVLILQIINIIVLDVVKVGFSTGLYAKLRNIDTNIAYKELMEIEPFSMDASNITISPINAIADIGKRDAVYRDFLNMLNLETNHKKYLEQQGLLKSSIESQMYRTIPKKYIKRRLVANRLSKRYDLAGVPGFYQEEDRNWTFSNVKGFFVPIFDENNKIQALSIHLDNSFNGSYDICFSSKDKINGTATKNLICRSNITENTETIVLTDDLILGNLIKDTINAPLIAFQSITNSYQILKVLDGTNIKNIIFTVRNEEKQNLDYIINRVFRDLIPLGYNLEMKYIRDYTDILKDDFLYLYTLERNTQIAA